jgi:hypothetical protein
MYSDGFNPLIMRLCAYCGFVFVFLWPFGAMVISQGQYILPPSANAPVSEVIAGYTDHLTSTRMAVTVLIFSTIFYTVWGMGVSMLTKKREGDYPILFYIQVVSLTVCVVVIFFIAYFWAGASWRAGETNDSVTRALNDMGWLGVLYTGAPFATYMITLAAQTFTDRSPNPIFPRWSAYFNIFVSMFMFEAAGILFFKTGPFSQNGIAVFWVPMVMFFSWIVVFARLTLKAISNEVASREAAGIKPLPRPGTAESRVEDALESRV